jgi:hypothetical protein
MFAAFADTSMIRRRATPLLVSLLVRLLKIFRMIGPVRNAAWEKSSLRRLLEKAFRVSKLIMPGDGKYSIRGAAACSARR